jgi:hypothetical protein
MHPSQTVDDSPLSAQVVLRAASGAPLRGDEPITTENLSRHLPHADEARWVTQAFRDYGFDVGPLVGISFAITAPRELFESTFGVSLKSAPVLGADLELPLASLAPAIAERVTAVTFTQPADLFL